ncbi:hypothetical protein QE152_g34503 [Popillia japonica]|uniref:SOWAHA-C winged helix-turn-helix domain-containing protein n=1 Tax=Popillia japonica TaxID=7064 RepID=A0AAW1ITT4_POPJA
MAASELSLEEILKFFVEKGGIVANRDVVRHFKKYLTDPLTQDDARTKFKKYVNQLATTKTEGNEKFLILRPKYSQNEELIQAFTATPLSPQYDSRNAIGPRQPPPYRPPPPVTPTSSSDNISISSSTFSIHSGSDLDNPYAPPRKKLSEKKLEAELKALENDNDNTTSLNDENLDQSDVKDVEKQSISVKERMQKFNKMATAEDELSPRQKDKKKQPERKVMKDGQINESDRQEKATKTWDKQPFVMNI